ncbi:MAG: hypothetical protein IPO63_07850 [Bacteroidetes bacterium]|nr:hypothetical protein [Bacteroidota bacterium]
MEEKFIYKAKSMDKLKNWFQPRYSKNRTEFLNFDEFYNWYSTLPKVCYYCGLIEAELQELIMTSKLTSKRFPEKGVSKQGKSRGQWLEFDRMHPEGKYSKANCVLSCYFCNNDKSDIFTAEEYKHFFKTGLSI